MFERAGLRRLRAISDKGANPLSGEWLYLKDRVKPMVTKAILVALLLGAGFFVYLQQRSGDTISGTEAQRLVAAGATLLDVRSPGEYAAGHIEGALNIPVDRLADRLDDLGNREGPIVIYCRSGRRSAHAKRILESEGFSHVSDLGGINRWP